MTGKTFPELTALSAPVVDSDVLAVYRSPGPLKKAAASTVRTYMQTSIPAANIEASLGRELNLSGERALIIWPTQDNYFAMAAGPAVEPTGVGNHGFGINALSSITTGVQNTAMGDRALENNETGSDHTAFGAGALQTQNGGVGCTAMGRLALANSTDGTNNTGLGDTALEFTTTGDANTAVGYSCLIRNTTGSHNTGLGLFAGGHFTVGQPTTFSFCTVVGSEAMQANISGDNNTLIGYRAGHVMTGGSNVSIGFEASRNQTSAAVNVAIGYRAGTSNISGGGNVFLGADAGNSGSQLANCFNSIAIGYQVITTKSNQCVIGNSSMTEIVLPGVQRGASYTVAGLTAVLTASAAGAGARSFVTDANATTFASVAAGGGANGVPVYSDGTNWRIG